MHPFLLIIFLSLLTFYKTFDLGFGGDDYFGLLDYFRTLGNSKYINLDFLLTHYGPQDTIMGLIHHVVGLNQRYYFIVSYILRMIAAFSFYPLVKYLTKNKFSSYISVLFFSVTYIGLETTSWVFNMASYLAIALFNFFLFYYLKNREKMDLIHLVIPTVLFFITIISQPIRMSSLIILCLTLETIFFVKSASFKNLYTSFIRSALFITAFFLIFFVGNSISSGKNFSERISNSWENKSGYTDKSVENLIKQGEYQIFINPIIQIGAIIIPDKIISSRNDPFLNSGYLVTTILFSSIFYLVIILFSKKLNTRNYLKHISHGLCISYSLFVLFLGHNYPEFFPTVISYIWFLVGGYYLMTLLILLIHFWKNKNMFIGVAISALWLIYPIAIIWLRFPFSVQPSFGRYLIMPAVSLSIFLGIISKRKKSENTNILFLVFIFIFLNFFSSNKYLSDLHRARNLTISEKIRKSLPKIKELEKESIEGHPLTFYFEGKEKEILYHTVLFGFPTIVAIQENLNYYPYVVITDNWQEVISSYIDGSPLPKYGWPVEPVPIENIYTYRLEGYDNLVETTKESRERLLSI